MYLRAIFGVIACGLTAVSVNAQVEPAGPAMPSPATSPTAPGLPADCAECVTIPALTIVRIELTGAVGSKISKSGDTFSIRLAEAIVIDGRTVIAAGTPGMGEVVHAKKSGGMGAAGELVLAARYLDLGEGRRLRLRSMQLAPVGQSKINTVNAIAMASAATVLPVSFIGFLIKGGQVTVEPGAIAQAKTAEAFSLPAMPMQTSRADSTGEKQQ